MQKHNWSMKHVRLTKGGSQQRLFVHPSTNQYENYQEAFKAEERHRPKFSCKIDAEDFRRNWCNCSYGYFEAMTGELRQLRQLRGIDDSSICFGSRNFICPFHARNWRNCCNSLVISMHLSDIARN